MTPSAGGSGPAIHEVNTWVWLGEVSRRAGEHVTLAAVPDSEWDRIVVPGVDMVWLMGVWERSPTGRDIARRPAGGRQVYRPALPDVTDDDIVGSPYCIRRYEVDP